MYTGLQHAHSGLRWVVLILLIYAIYNAYTGWKSNRSFLEKDRKINLFAMISVHIMLLLGLSLYFLGGWYQIDGEVMKTPALRFYAVEHISMMIISIVLITIGNAKSKRGSAITDPLEICYRVLLVIRNE